MYPAKTLTASISRSHSFHFKTIAVLCSVAQFVRLCCLYLIEHFFNTSYYKTLIKMLILESFNNCQTFSLKPIRIIYMWMKTNTLRTFETIRKAKLIESKWRWKKPEQRHERSRWRWSDWGDGSKHPRSLHYRLSLPWWCLNFQSWTKFPICVQLFASKVSRRRQA